MQDKIRINDIEIFQPDEGLQSSFETTYSEDSTRLQDGTANFVPLFTVEQFSYSATNVPVADAAVILQQVIKGESFKLHYFSPYFGAWRDGMFRVGKGQFNIGSVEDGSEVLSSLSFNMTGEEPLL